MSLKDWSTTADSNTSAPPNGAPEGMAVANVNNTMRQMMADVRTLAAEDTIASATTCDLGTKDATFLTITGTTTITGFGTVSAGIYKIVRFSGALTLTHNATSLILLTGANRTTVAGDCGLYKSEGSGNWREYFYSGLGAASESATGVVELATTAEAAAGTDTARATTAAGVAAAIAALGLGGSGQTWQDVTVSRAASTAYYNTTGRPICVSVVSTDGPSGYLDLYVNDIRLSRDGDNNSTPYAAFTAFAIVPPGASYHVIAGTVGIDGWLELR